MEGSFGTQRMIMEAIAIGVAILAFLSVFTAMKLGSNQSSPASGCGFPAIFNFGDSNSDTGAASATFGRLPPPNGRTFFGKPSGRSSDGRLIIDFVANRLYAMSLPRPEWFSKALYTTYIGQNDLHAGLISLTEEQVKASIPGLIDHFASVIEKLYQEGARAFWIHNTGPIGCLPYFVIPSPPKPGNADLNGCIKSYNEVAEEFNKQLRDRVTQLRTIFHDALLVYVDIYKAKYSLISEANQHGFVNPLEYCCGRDEDSSIKCWDAAVVNGTKVYGASCSNPSEYINWDGVHYTEAANHWLSDRILDGSLSDPPVPLTEACLKNAHAG